MIGKCNACGATDVEVRRFSITVEGQAGGPLVDLCDDDEAMFLRDVSTYIGDEDASDLRREDESA